HHLDWSLYLYYYLSYSSADRRDLHSFPTRRSSDLVEAPAGVEAVASDRALLEQVLPGYIEGRRWFAGREREMSGVRVLDVLPLGDRKSTRLNSSHVKISYAVFCLKKKKEWDRQDMS